MQHRWDDFLLDLDGFRLERAGVPVPLEPKALNLLALVVQRPGHVFTKQELFDTLWPGTAVTDHALTRVVSQLRRGLGDEAREARYLETVPTRGYRWLRPMDPPPAEAPEALVSSSASPASPFPAATRRRWLNRTLAAALVVVAAAAMAGTWVRGSPSVGADAGQSGSATAGWTEARDPAWPVQQTTHDGLDLHPAFSPLGDALAFASDRSGEFEIYVRALDGGGGDIALTSDRGQNVQPAWSPDGRQIAFHSSARGGVWVMPARGGPARQLAATGSHPTWAPDGRRLVFQSDELTDVTPSAYGATAGSTLWVVDADGRGLRPLTQAGQPPGGHALPAWTRDGRRVAFMVFDGAQSNGIWMLDVAGDGGAPRLLDPGRGLYEFTFAPDGSALYAAGGSARILRIALDAATGEARGPRVVLPVPGVPGVRGLAISADGTGLAFSGIALNSQLWGQRVARDGTPAGDARAITTDTSRRNSLAAISPDGTRIAYMSSRQGAPPSVWMMDTDGANRLPLTPDESADGEPAWFADGRRVAYRSNRGGADGMWVVDVMTRREAPWLEVAATQRATGAGLPEGSLGELRFAPSMAAVAFTMRAAPTGNRALYVTPLGTYAPRRLTDGATSVGYPAWSPDGRTLAVEVKDGTSIHAALVDVATGQLRQITRDRGQMWVRSWSPDGRRLAAAARSGGRWGLRWIDPASGDQGVITPPAPPRVYVRYPEWSPRGDLIVFERGELRGNIWTLRLPAAEVPSS